MNIKICTDYREMSRAGADIVLHELGNKPDLLLCAATGSSPSGLYAQLAVAYAKSPEEFAALRVLKLDEWGGLNMDNPATCEAYLQKHLVGPLGIQENRYTAFYSNPNNPEEECRRIRTYLQNNGPADVCILGMGMNGHLALNEPGNYLRPYAHVAQLSDRSLTHSMLEESQEKPAYGLTLGIAEILASRKIIFLVSGNGKEELFRKFMEQKITTVIPATMLWLHRDVHCLVDKSSIDIQLTR